MKSKFSSIKLLSLDVDGVLTDGGLYYGDDGGQIRKFNVKDGMGMKRLMDAGVHIAIISASKAQCILKRAEDLAVEHVHIGVEDKLAALQGVCDELGVTLAETAHMGDDLNDIMVLEAVGVGLTVADAITEVKELADFVSEKNGGAGAVREVCDLIVESKS